MALDLHIHSSCSDGTLTPVEIVNLAHRKGLRGISITDHDSISSYELAKEAAGEVDLKLLSGVELSVHYSGLNIHLLGYGFDSNNEKLQESLYIIQNGRVKRNREILQKIAQSGFVISDEEYRQFEVNRNFGRPHIARLLIKVGAVSSVREAFNQYLTPGGKAYVPRPIFELERAVNVLHKAGGVALVAHPFNIDRKDIEVEDLLDGLRACAIDGVEVYYPTHSKKMRQCLLNYCEKNDLIGSGGSDYHGNMRPGTYLAGGKNVFVPEEVLDNLELRIQRYA